jgi:hypothetical protein
MTYRNESRWDKGEFSKRNHVSNENKEAMTRYYQAGLKVGKSSDELLEALSQQYKRTPRQIQRYISQITKPKDLHLNEDDGLSKTLPVKDNHPPEPELKTQLGSDNGEVMLETFQEKTDKCLASPDGIDANVLKSWGVPLGKRAEIISQWRSWHKRGMHDICQAFTRLQQDLEVRKFSYKVAEVLLNADVWALEFQVDELHESIDLYRIYRPREHIKSYQAFIKEMEEMHIAHYKISPRHINDIENLLNQLRKVVLISKDTKEYEGLLKMEEKPLFEILESHCFNVYDCFWALKNDLENIRSLDLRTIQGGSNQTQVKPTKKERIILQEKLDNSTKELQRAIDYALRVKIYSISECHLCTQDTRPETNC